MIYLERSPAPPLSRFVRCLWALEADVPPPSAGAERIAPDGCVEAVLHLGAPFLRRAADDAAPATQHRLALVGQLERWIDIQPTGPASLVGIRFEPAGAAAFVAVPQSELAGRSLPLEDAWGRAALELEEALGERPDPAARLGLLEAWLLRRLRAPGRPRTAVEAAVDAITASGGGLSPSRLAVRVGMGLRQLERRFAAEVGLSPKRLARIVRLRRALAMARAGTGTWGGIAAECGYADQAHLNRDFRDLLGRSPGGHVGADSALGGCFD